MCILRNKVPGSKLLTMSLFFPVASLAIGLAWVYRSITRKEYAGLLIAAGFVLLAIFAFVRK
jgi:hypothetical protein